MIKILFFIAAILIAGTQATFLKNKKTTQAVCNVIFIDDDWWSLWQTVDNTMAVVPSGSCFYIDRFEDDLYDDIEGIEAKDDACTKCRITVWDQVNRQGHYDVITPWKKMKTWEPSVNVMSVQICCD